MSCKRDDMNFEFAICNSNQKKKQHEIHVKMGQIIHFELFK